MSNVASMFARKRPARASAPAPAPVEPSTPSVSGPRGLTGFRHGIYVSMSGSSYKGRQAIVTEFNPALYELKVSGTDYVEVRNERVNQVGDSIFTELGESLIKDYIPANRNQKYFKVYLFREPNNPNTQIGIEITKLTVVEQNLKKQGHDQYAIPHFLSDPMRLFVYKIPVDDTVAQITNTLSQLNFDQTQDLINQMSQLNIQNQPENQLQQLIQKLNEHHDEILDKVYHTEFSGQFEITMIIKSNVLEKYFINKDNFNDVKTMDPSVSHYLVDYVRNQRFALNQVERTPALTNFEKQIKHREDIKRQLSGESLENFYPSDVKVTAGPFRGKTFPFVAFHPAHVRVDIDNKNISTHLVVIRDETGNKLRSVYSRIFDTDVFYQDITLENGEYAQIKRIDPINNQLLRVVTRGGQEQVLHIHNDRYTLNQGVKLIFDTTEQEPEQEQEIRVQPQHIFSDEMDQEVQEVTDETPEEDDDYYGYEAPEESGSPMEQVDEKAVKQTFKDLERTQRELRQLTNEEKDIKKEIQTVLNKLGANDSEINVYDLIDKISNLLKNLSRVNANNVNLLVTANFKYIVVCMVLYELLTSHFTISLDDAVDSLLTSYFNTNDFRPTSLNQTIFIRNGTWSPYVAQNHLEPILARINEHLQSNNYREILRAILTNADLIIQSITGTALNVTRRRSNIPEDLIPLGLNIKTGRRYKDEALDMAMERLRSSKHQTLKMVSVNDLIEGTLPENEMPIYWSLYQNVLDTYQAELQSEAERLQRAGDTNTANAYRSIIPVLEKGPFGSRHVHSQLRELYNQLYRQLRSRLTNARLDRTRIRIDNEEARRVRGMLFAQGPDAPTPEIPSTSRSDDMIRKMLKRSQARREAEAERKSEERRKNAAPFVALTPHHVPRSEVADEKQEQPKSKRSKKSKQSKSE